MTRPDDLTPAQRRALLPLEGAVAHQTAVVRSGANARRRWALRTLGARVAPVDTWHPHGPNPRPEDPRG
jgi:hypothetical protein